MNWIRRRLGLCVFVATVCWSVTPLCHAQLQGAEATGGVRKRQVLAIRKLEGTGRRAKVLTPIYEVSVPTSGGSALREWGRVRVEYATRPEWMDDLTIRFYAIGSVREQGRNLYSLYRKEVRYMDVEAGSDHLAEVYIRPSALDRYGEILAVAVEFVVEGEVVAAASDPRRASGLPEEWWKDPRVVKSDAVKIRDAHILNRRESPFAYANINAFEAIR